MASFELIVFVGVLIPSACRFAPSPHMQQVQMNRSTANGGSRPARYLFILLSYATISSQASEQTIQSSSDYLFTIVCYFKFSPTFSLLFPSSSHFLLRGTADTVTV
jgi:hypothetical protein